MNAPLDIDGRLVDRRLLEQQAVARCRIARCEAVCCAHGVFVSVAQAEDIRAHRRWIAPHLPRERTDPRRYDCSWRVAAPVRPLYQTFRAEMALALGESRLARLDGIVAADLGPFVLRTPREGP